MGPASAAISPSALMRWSTPSLRRISMARACSGAMPQCASMAKLTLDQACEQVPRDGGGSVVENFVLGLDFIDVTTQVTESIGRLRALASGISFRTPVNASQDFSDQRWPYRRRVRDASNRPARRTASKRRTPSNSEPHCNARLPPRAREGWRRARCRAMGAMASSGVVIHTTPRPVWTAARRRLVVRSLAALCRCRLTARSAAARVRQATKVRRCPRASQKPSQRLAHSTSTNKRNIIACSGRLHAVSPGKRSNTSAPYCAWPASQGQAYFTAARVSRVSGRRPIIQG